jgi:hypothetical protein
LTAAAKIYGAEFERFNGARLANYEGTLDVRAFQKHLFVGKLKMIGLPAENQ